MNLEALAIDVVPPALEKAGLNWHGWHAFRRGLATNLHRFAIRQELKINQPSGPTYRRSRPSGVNANNPDCAVRSEKATCSIDR
jgi:hypothetical protein